MRIAAGPTDADAKPAVLRQPITPFIKPTLQRPDIGNVGRNCRQLGVERQWQAQKRAIKSNSGTASPSLSTRETPGTVASDRLERRLNAEDDFGAERSDQRRVAHEIDGIAQPLLGQRGTPSCRPGPFAVPLPSRNSGRGAAKCFFFQRYSYCFQPFAKVADAQPGNGCVEIRFGFSGSIASARA